MSKPVKFEKWYAKHSEKMCKHGFDMDIVEGQPILYLLPSVCDKILPKARGEAPISTILPDSCCDTLFKIATSGIWRKAVSYVMDVLEAEGAVAEEFRDATLYNEIAGLIELSPEEMEDVEWLHRWFNLCALPTGKKSKGKKRV